MRPHEPVVGVPGNSRGAHGRLRVPRRDLVRIEMAPAEVIQQTPHSAGVFNSVQTARVNRG